MTHHSEPPMIAATLLRDQIALANEVYGVDVVEEAMRSLPEEEAVHLKTATALGWIPLSTSHAFHRALARVTGRDEVESLVHLVRAGTERTFTTVWRMFLRLTSLNQMVKRGATVFHKTYNRGRAEATLPNPDTMRLTVTEWPQFPEYEAHALAAGLQSIIEVSGRKNVKVRWKLTSDGIVLDIVTKSDD